MIDIASKIIFSERQLQQITGGTLGNTLKSMRENVGLTEKDLAIQLNVTTATLFHYENDKRQPDIKFLKTYEKCIQFVNFYCIKIVKVVF